MTRRGGVRAEASPHYLANYDNFTANVLCPALLWGCCTYYGQWGDVQRSFRQATAFKAETEEDLDNGHSLYIHTVTPFSPILTFWQLCRSEHNEDTVNALMYGEPLDKLSLNCSRMRSATETGGQDGSDIFECPRSRVHVLFALLSVRLSNWQWNHSNLCKGRFTRYAYNLLTHA